MKFLLNMSFKRPAAASIPTRQDRIEEDPCTNITYCLARGLDLIDPIG